MTHDPMKSAAADAAATAAAYSARNTYALGWEAGQRACMLADGDDFRTLEAQRDAAIRARDEVGIQYAAAQAVIASWSPVIRASQALCGVGGTDKHSRCFERLCAAVAALDTVPGDALTHPTRHLEALGIDTDNVKGGE